MRRARHIFAALLLAIGASDLIQAAPVQLGDGEVNRRLEEYRGELDAFRREHPATRALPGVDFFLFGMGSRPKLLYKSGTLRHAVTGEVIRSWPVRSAVILPPDYAVFLTATNGQRICVIEDERGVWIKGDGPAEFVPGSQSPIRLPEFTRHRYPRILRVLHHELLVNVIEGKPVPNFFVYPKPWYRDGAMMAMCFKETGNLDVIKEWVLRLSEPYDRNNAGETEADNLGQALYLLSLFSDRHHPLVATIQRELARFEVQGPEGKYIQGRSDFAEHPVYQTRWAKFGLAALNLPDPYVVPQLPDSYAALCWWADKDKYVPGKDAHDGGPYPYLGWACDHFHGAKSASLSERDYPLTWEQRASQAKYEGMRIISDEYTQQSLASPHTWHAAEAFLYLLTALKN